ncbi:Gryzun, putative trafficking through golgi-domain-containing protein [Kalaharituber pfeilii]|nr:Gryzun, putative trafficking through golgi-domain-containing protein [Kalaharituber pfeilii]
MDAYPPSYVEHNVPLLVLSGLRSTTDDAAQAGAPTHIACPIPPLDTPLANTLLRCFLATNASGIWSGKPDRSQRTRGPAPVFRIKAVGRDYYFPPRKANPPPLAAPTSPTPEALPSRTLHSPLSPHSPQSPLFPDGVMTHLWLSKHQDLVPAAFISCFELFTEAADSATQAQKDNELIKAINDLKRQFGTSTSTNIAGSGSPTETNARRTRFAVIIISEKSVLHSPEIDERLGIIRRATGLDNNSTFFFLPSPSTPIEMQAFAKNVQLRLFPSCLEYYRDLSKHCRRKRKNPIPSPTVPPTTASTALSDAGWGIRYEIKLGIFAEFRQEMDAAARSYETAYESLISNIFSVTNSWSERWNEARLLVDMLTLRAVRCALWLESWTGAVRRWEYHIKKMRVLIDIKGKGTETYGFAAWMAIWNRAFAELIQAANIHIFAPVAPEASNALVPSVVTNPDMQVYAPPEKAIQLSDKVRPQEHLHHSGFYYLAAANYAADRHTRILKYAEAEPYDDYLCYPPNEESTKVDHYGIQIELFELAKKEFTSRGQKRMADMISHNIARLKVERAKGTDLEESLALLRELCTGYRQENWIPLLEEVLWRMVDCSKRSGDSSAQIVAELELLSSRFQKRPGWTYDLMKCLEATKNGIVRPVITLREEDVIPFFSASFTFKTPEACVADAVVSQLVMASNAHKGSAPVVWSRIRINIEGSMKAIILTHESTTLLTPPDTHNIRYIDIQGKLQEQILNSDKATHSPSSPKAFLKAATDLSLYPGETKIIELSTILREAGEAKAITAVFELSDERPRLEIVVELQLYNEGWTDDLGIGKNVGFGSRNRSHGEITLSGGNSAWWMKDRQGRFRKKPVRSEQPASLRILPKPPKIDLVFAGLHIPAFLDETIEVKFEICNYEDEEAEASLQVTLIGYPEGQGPPITWISSDDKPELETTSLYPLGTISTSSRVPTRFTFPVHTLLDVAVEIAIHYHLLSDPETPIIKIVTLNIPVVSPFSIGHEWNPRVHPDKWPSYFSLSDDLFAPDAQAQPKPTGLTQRWCLTTLITTVQTSQEHMGGTETEGGRTALVVDEWELVVSDVGNGAHCSVLQAKSEGLGIVMNTSKPIEAPFILDIQRLTFEDRRPTHVDASLYITWRRGDSTSLNTSKIPIPRLFIPGSEPRVLAVAKKAPNPPHHILLDYCIENPTNYFLTFSIVMEANEAFAFSGPKQSSLQLAPLSKVNIRYHIWPFVRNAWIRPVLRVEDKYFNKTLRSISGGERGTMTIDKEKGVVVWVGSWDEGGNEPDGQESEKSNGGSGVKEATES